MKGRDSIAVGVGLKVGGRNESKRISGMSHFIEHLVFKGTKKRTAKKIKEEVEGRGGVLNGYTSEDTTFFFIKITKKHFDYALEILADMVQNPLFSMHDIERERTVILEEIKMYMDMPMHYAYDLINSLLWPNQPLGRFVAGNFNSVSRIRHRDLKKYHQCPAISWFQHAVIYAMMTLLLQYENILFIKIFHMGVHASRLILLKKNHDSFFAKEKLSSRILL